MPLKRTVTSVVKGLFLDLAVIAASVYLTFAIGEYMPDLPADQLLVFGCTAAVCACLVYAFGALRRKFPQLLRFTAVSFGFAAVSAGLLLTAFQGGLLPRIQFGTFKTALSGGTDENTSAEGEGIKFAAAKAAGFAQTDDGVEESPAI
ncbi:hypothetical protein [Acutalibacter muris]|uniref:hypothetical protein n=1 Tax=Acutalibacter muris TaxID=1796620 RepID=UPI00272E641D|nr:hypothetical protein [Acutalibacter muris]